MSPFNRLARRLMFVVGSLACVAWVGCNAILGNESAVFEPDAASSSSSGASSGVIDGSLDGPSSSSGFPDGTPPPDGANPDAGPCVNISENPHHCGACFHDCLGGSCAASKCQPVVLTTEPGTPTALALDDTHVYWTNTTSGDLKRVAKTGGNAEVVFNGPDTTDLGKEIAVNNGRVYFTYTVGDAGLVSCPVAGCGVMGPEPVVPNGAPVDSVSISDNALMFVEFNNPGRVLRCPLPCTSGAFEVVAQNEVFPLRATTNGATQAWTELNSVRIHNGGPPTTIYNNGGGYAVALVANDVIFVDPGDGPRAVLRDGGGLRTLASVPLGFYQNMAIDGPDLYFTDQVDDGTLYRCPTIGGDGGVATIATKQATPAGVAVDGAQIFWANNGGTVGTGTIERIAK